MYDPTPVNEPTGNMPPFTVQPKLADLPTKREVWRIREIENRFGPNYIVRVARRIADTNTPLECQGEEYDELVYEGEKQAKVLLKLENDYGIQIPPCYFVVGNTEGFRPEYDEVIQPHGRYSLYQAVHKVMGPDLNDLAFRYDQFQAEIPKHLLEPYLDTLVCSLIEYLISHIKNQEPFLYDIFKPTQFVFGSTQANHTPSVYLVDTEVLLEDVTSRSIQEAVENIFTMMNKFEALIGVTLNNARTKSNDLVEAKNKLETF